MSDPNIYTVGWICAITCEYVAAQIFLDEKHEIPDDLSPSNKSDYTLGRIGKHNVVISVLPLGSYSTSSVSRVAEDMLHSFPNVRIGLLVGIGGGAPSPKNDIRLGDVVVSIPRNGRGGVIQYDFGETIQGQKFKLTGSLYQPPTVLRAAVNGLRAQYEMDGHELEKTVEQALAKKPRLKRKYRKPDPASDRLYQTHIVHPPEADSTCDLTCGEDPNSLVFRDPRPEDEDTLVIHYGLVASANQLMQNALIRDQLSAEMEVLCFETEAAGLMNHFPCLVIRGICDYSDSHANQEWQGYAAMIAAAYARDILHRMIPQHIEKEEKILEILKPHIEHMTKAIDQIHLIVAFDKLPLANGAEYNSYMDQHEPECLPGTRTELIREIKEWVFALDGTIIFWLNGMAGTGKSTISRTLAKLFNETKHLGAAFFFKSGEADRGNASKLISTLVRQLTHNYPEFSGAVQKTLEDDPDVVSKSLQEQFDNLLLKPLLSLGHPDHDQPPIIVIVIDALDECDNDRDVRKIIRLLPLLHKGEAVRFRIFLTSRPELPIRLGFSSIENQEHRDLALHEIPEEVTAHDISLFLHHKFAKIKLDRGISGDWPEKSVIEALLAMSVPLFISAATVCRYVENSKWDPKSRLTELLADQAKYVSRMEKTYLPILKSLLSDQENDESENEQLLQEFQDIVGIIINLAAPLSIDALSSFVGMEADRISNRLEFFRSVLSIPENRNEPVRMLHLSFRDFLIQPGNIFSVDKTQKHMEITRFCLRTMKKMLRKNICNLENLGVHREDIDPQVLHKQLPPVLRYSCCYWVDHLRASLSPEKDLLHFLHEHFLHWIEVLSLLGLISNAVGMLESLHTLGLREEHNGKSIREFSYDAKRFVMKYQQIADQAPLQVYCAGLVFAPRDSIVRQTFKQDIPQSICHYPEEEFWNAELQALDGHSDLISSLAFSPCEELLASGSYDCTVRLWDLGTGGLQQTLDHPCRTTSVAFSPDGSLLVSGDDVGTLRLWDMTTGALQRTLQASSNMIRSVAFSKNGQLLASCSNEAMARLWDLETCDLKQSLNHESWVCSVGFSPDDRQFVSCSFEKIRIWDANTGCLQQTLKSDSIPDLFQSVEFSPDGQMIASGSHHGKIRLWDVSTGNLQQTIEASPQMIRSVAFSPRKQLLASSSINCTIRLWDLAMDQTQQLLQTLHGHTNDVRSIAFSPGGSILASGSTDRTIRLWDMEMNHRERSIPDTHAHEVISLAFSPDGQVLASGSYGNKVHIWDAPTGRVGKTLDGPSGIITALSFSPDGSLLAVGSHEEKVRIWNTETWTLEQTLEGHSFPIWSVAFSSDGQLIASGSSDQTVRVWNPVTGALHHILDSQIHSSYSVGFSSDNTLLAAGHGDLMDDGSYPVYLWRLETGELLHKLWGHVKSVRSIAFSPDQRLLATGSKDETVRVWDTMTGDLRDVLNCGGPINEIVFIESDLIKTNVGFFDIPSLSGNSKSRPPRADSQIFLKKDWIYLNEKKFMWVPSDERPVLSATRGNRIALGHAGNWLGRVTFIHYPTDSEY